MSPSLSRDAAGSDAKAPAPANLVAAETTAKFAYVGTFTTAQREARTAKGIMVYFITPSGYWQHTQTVELMNPSYLAMDSNKCFLYACQGDGRHVTSFAVNPADGHLTMLNKMESSGANGVHLALSSNDKFLLLANYFGGTVDSFPVKPDGSLGERVSTVSTQGGTGVLKSQGGSYPHHITVVKNRFVTVPDKGRDLVHVLAFDGQTGAITPHTTMYSRPGVGSRHMSFHPVLPYAYVMEECDNAITVCTWDEGKGALAPLQWVPLTPATYFFGYRGTNEEGGGAIWVDPEGAFVYGTHRGLDTIAAFKIDKRNGFLTPLAWEPTQGVRPRFFTFDPSGKTLFVANQIGGTIMAFRQNKATGKLTPVGKVVEIDSPTCILFR